ncbi:hypothetical protein [Streptomyces sp. NPDC047042]|uniref:hypothetical protein n=1 Tax=Streptomyces sp. NPDC047042 TaxID=3154807 RepID=UPI0033F37942
MSEFSESQGTSSMLSVPSVDQIVFRWEGNLGGRQGTGMRAVAHSCPAERAEQFGRDLGALLWVSGPGAARPSVVRTLSGDGKVMLVQRWPTLDRTGRPSTISHVLVGAPGTLKTRQCLALAYGGWGNRKSAEAATGSKSKIECATLDSLVLDRLPMMQARLEKVRGALILATAEWLRDPAQRVSFLVEGEEETRRKGRLPGWPDQDDAPLVYLGLFLLFHDWPGHEWTFATYDTVDTHPLRLTSVPRWEQDTGGYGPLARIMGGNTTDPRFEHQAASRLVDHLLAHPYAAAGVPQLAGELSDGATMDWERRKDLLRRILSADRRRADTVRPETVRPETPPTPMDPPPPPPRQPPEQQPEYEEQQPPYQHLPQPQPLSQPLPQPQFQPPPPYRVAPQHEEPQPPYAHAPHHPHQLHEDLRHHERGNQMQRSILMAQLHELPDDVLLNELRSDELPPESVELLLSELGTHQRLTTRPLEMQQALCEHALSKNLYLTPHGGTGGPMSGAAQASRAAHLFTWAVAPLARDKRYKRDLHELMELMSRSPHPIGSNWLAQSILSPPHGKVPDLPPSVWRQLLHDALTREEKPQPATVPPPPSPVAPDSPASMSRLSELSNNVGCVVGVSFAVIVVLIAIALMVM